MLLRKTFLALCTLILIALPALETDAQRRGGGGRGGGGRANVSRSGPAGHGSARHHNRHHDRARTRGAVRRESRSERHEYWEDRGRRRRIGAALTVASYRALSCRPTTVIVDGVAFYSCGGGWYTRRVYSGTVTYVVVTAPAGY